MFIRGTSLPLGPFGGFQRAPFKDDSGQLPASRSDKNRTRTILPFLPDWTSGPPLRLTPARDTRKVAEPKGPPPGWKESGTESRKRSVQEALKRAAEGMQEGRVKEFTPNPAGATVAAAQETNNAEPELFNRANSAHTALTRF